MTVDVQAPARPTIATIADDNVIDAGEAQDGITIRGTAEANATMVVTWGGISETTQASATGAWTVTFDTTPGVGRSTVSAVAQDAAGNQSAAGTRAVTVEPAPPPPPPPQPPPPPVISVIAGDDIVDAGEAAAGVTVSGTAQAGASVSVTWGSTVLTTDAGPTGAWLVTFTPDNVPATSQPVVAVASNQAGASLPTSREVTIQPPEPPPDNASTPDTATDLPLLIADLLDGHVDLFTESDVNAGMASADIAPATMPYPFSGAGPDPRTGGDDVAQSLTAADSILARSLIDPLVQQSPGIA